MSLTTDRVTLRPPGPPVGDAPWSMRSASLTAGIGLLLMAALSGVGFFAAVEALVTPGDAARTATDIRASEGLFRLGVVSLFAVVALDVVVAWALYRVFRPVSHGLSMLAAGLRLVYSGVFMVAIGHLVSAVDLLGSGNHQAVLGTPQVQAEALLEIDTFHDVWSAGLVLFGLHLLVVGYLAYRSGIIPRVLGVLLAVVGLGYVFDSFAVVLSGGALPEVSTFTGAGELVLAIWLLIRGGR